MGNFDCIGFRADSAEDLVALVEQTLPTATHLGTGPKGAETFRWQDSSGARVMIEKRGEIVHNMLPSFAGKPSTMLTDVVRLNDDTSAADVVDESGEMITRLAVDLEQRALLANASVHGRAALVGLAGELTLHADAAAFQASDASRMGGTEEVDPPPPHLLEQGIKWPPRWATESFVSEGLFSAPRESRPIAMLNGVVIEADERVNSLTGVSFIRARVRTIGFEVDICASVAQMSSTPTPGQVIGARVYMVGSLESWTVDASVGSSLRSRLFGRFRGSGH